jgi:acetolactate synthase-1/2/3 large subunit
MGFAAAVLPAARLVHPRRPALCFVGDGSFHMVMNIVPMAAQYGLAVTWCVLNDDTLGSIRDLQEHTYGNRIQDTEFPFQPDFAPPGRGLRRVRRTRRRPGRRT